jgi:hypothetical protein
MTTSGHEAISINSWNAGVDYRYYVRSYSRDNFNTSVNVKVFRRDTDKTVLVGQRNSTGGTNADWNVITFRTSAATIEPIVFSTSYDSGSVINITGNVRDALTDDPILGATISFDHDKMSYSATTDAGGNFAINNVPNKDVFTNRDITVSAPGYKNTVENISLSSSINRQYFLFPSSWNGQYAIVLNWINPPADLDSHLTFGSCHINYGARVCGDSSLDRDDTNSGTVTLIDGTTETDDVTKGHEAIAITSRDTTAPSYKYWVDNWSYSSAGFTSAARVRVFTNEGGQAVMSRECIGQNRTERYWDVFDFPGSMYPFTANCLNNYHN